MKIYYTILVRASRQWPTFKKMYIKCYAFWLSAMGHWNKHIRSCASTCTAHLIGLLSPTKYQILFNEWTMYVCARHVCDDVKNPFVDDCAWETKTHFHCKCNNRQEANESDHLENTWKRRINTIVKNFNFDHCNSNRGKWLTSPEF